jgi:hypothetical protein
MLAAEWHLIDESYGWPALGFSAVWITQFLNNNDESCRFRRNLRECCDHPTLVPAAHE